MVTDGRLDGSVSVDHKGRLVTRLFDTACYAALVVCCAWMLATGCTARPEAREPERGETRHCFRLRFAFDGRSQAAIACAESIGLCRNAQARAMKWGAMMGAEQVGACKEER